MIRTLAFVSAAALLVSAAGPAFAQYSPHSSMGPHTGAPPSGAPSTAKPPSVSPAVTHPPVSHAPPSDEFGGPRTEHFITALAQSDEFERHAGEMAERKGVSPRVREFGSMMVRDHTKTTQDLQAAIRRTGHAAPPTPPLSGAQQHMLEQLRTSGANFDALYLQQQVQAHQDALGELQSYARDGHNAVLRDAARQTIPLVQNHLAMAQQLLANIRR